METKTDKAQGLPAFVCHKTVHAFKVKSINYFKNLKNPLLGAELIPFDSNIAPRTVSQDYVDKHKPQVFGYYVLYLDGYESWSPAGPFESGYELKSEPQPNVPAPGPITEGITRVPDIRNRFGYRSLNETGIISTTVIREGFSRLNDLLENRVMPSREYSLCLTKLEEACMFAIKGVSVDPANQS